MIVQRDPELVNTSKQGKWEIEFRRDYPKLKGVGRSGLGDITLDPGVMTPTGIRVPSQSGGLLEPRKFYERRAAAFLAYQGFIHYAELVEAGHDAAATAIAIELLKRTGRQVPKDTELDLAAYTHWSYKAVNAAKTVELGLLLYDIAIAGRALLESTG